MGLLDGLSREAIYISSIARTLWKLRDVKPDSPHTEVLNLGFPLCKFFKNVFFINHYKSNCRQDRQLAYLNQVSLMLLTILINSIK